MPIDWTRLLPARPGGSRSGGGPLWLLVAVNIAGTVRSLIHILAPDGGAQSIAGIRVDVAGGANTVAIFAQWGASQLILALIIWVVIAKYRALIPLMWLAIAAEQLLRMLAGHLKPVLTEVPPPGAYGTYILLPFAIAVLFWSLWDRGGNSRAEVETDA